MPERIYELMVVTPTSAFFFCASTIIVLLALIADLSRENGK